MSRRPRRRREIFECPNCGASVPVGAKACKECGSDDTTGWQSAEEIDYQSIDIPDGYGPDDEGGDAGSGARGGARSPWTAVVIVVLVVALLVLALWR
ncbi:MAG: hypothetical protein AB7O97_23000 [Planctomycetota bacterium]